MNILCMYVDVFVCLDTYAKYFIYIWNMLQKVAQIVYM